MKSFYTMILYYYKKYLKLGIQLYHTFPYIFCTKNIILFPAIAMIYRSRTNRNGVKDNCNLLEILLDKDSNKKEKIQRRYIRMQVAVAGRKRRNKNTI